MRSVLLPALLALCACGCTASRTTLSGSTVVKGEPDPGNLPVTPHVLEQLPAGRQYRVRTNDPRKSYVGRVVKADSEKLVLADVTYEQKTERKTPVLGSLPLLSRAFTKTGVRSDRLYGDWTFTRPQITGVELLGSPVAPVSDVAEAAPGARETPPDRLVEKAKSRTARDG